jgi:hypothetical protein
MFCPRDSAEWVPPTSDTGSSSSSRRSTYHRPLPPSRAIGRYSLPRRVAGPSSPHMPRRQAPGSGPIPPTPPACLADRRRPPALTSTHASPTGGDPWPQAPCLGPEFQALDARTSAAEFHHKIWHRWSPVEQFLSATSFAELLSTSSVLLHHRFAILPIVVVHCLTMVSTPMASSLSSLLFVQISAPLARRSASESIGQSRHRPWEHAPKSLQKGPPKIM